MQIKFNSDYKLGKANEPMGCSFGMTLTLDIWNRLLLFRLENNIPSMSLAAKRLLVQFCETLPAAPPDTEV